MLTVDQARDIANVWRPKFTDEEAFATSWSRYMDMVKDQSPVSLVAWLETDQQRDAVRAAGIVHEPALPVRQADAWQDALQAAVDARPEPRHDCWKCGKFEDEPAGETCSNPHWHLPNVNSPALHAPDGWKHVA